MNKKYISLITTMLCVPILTIGCAEKGNFTNKQDNAEEMSDYEKEKMVKKEYISMLNEDLSNTNEIAQKYLKEVFNEETEVIKEFTTVSGTYSDAYLKLKSNPDIQFTVRLDKKDEDIVSEHNSVITSKILTEKFNEEFKALLPEGAKIYIEDSCTVNDPYSIEGYSIDELIENKKLNIFWATLSIPTYKEYEDIDFEVYRDLILEFSEKLNKAEASYMDIVFAADNSHIDAIKSYYDDLNDKEMPRNLCYMMDSLEHSSLYTSDDEKKYIEAINNTFQGKIHEEFNLSLENDLKNEEGELPVKSLIIENPKKK